MRLSLFVNPRSVSAQTDHSVAEHAVQQARRADRAGYSAVFLTEHHFSGVNGYADPYLMGAHLAGQLEHAYLGIAVATVPYHHPLRLVEYANVLDMLTKGRLIFGLGGGGVSQAEWDAFGLDRDARRQMTEQRIEVMLKAWAHDPQSGPLDVSTDFDAGSLTGRLMPGPYRRPHPLLARGTASDSTIRETGERGWPVMFGLSPTAEQLSLYREGLDAGGHDEATVRECLDWVAYSQYVWVGETDAEAWEQARPYVEQLAKGSGHLKKRVGARLETVNVYRDEQEFIDRSMIVGSPETVLEKLQHSMAQTGIDHVRTWFTIAAAPLEQVTRSMDLFCDAVAPKLQPERMPDPRLTAA